MQDVNEPDYDLIFSALNAAAVTVAGKTDYPLCVWSIWDSLADARKVLNNDTFAQGPCRFDYDGGWGKPVDGEVLTDPTYHDVWIAASRAVALSGDRHHVFLEMAQDEGVDEKGVRVFSFWFGS